jgi:hypothetical protein
MSSIHECFDGFERPSGLGTQYGVLKNTSRDDASFDLRVALGAGQS